MKLKVLMALTNVTQVTLAKKLGIKQQTVSNWVNGICRPQYEFLIPLSLILNTTVETVISAIMGVSP